MTKTVIPDNDYDSLRADGTRDTRGISRMWNVAGHEAARLPMIYAAAGDITGKQEYYDLYQKYLASAIEQSFTVADWQQPSYALLQMQDSMELLLSLEKSAHALTQLDYQRVSSNGIFYLQAAYWKLRRR